MPVMDQCIRSAAGIGMRGRVRGILVSMHVFRMTHVRQSGAIDAIDSWSATQRHFQRTS